MPRNEVVPQTLICAALLVFVTGCTGAAATGTTTPEVRSATSSTGEASEPESSMATPDPTSVTLSPQPPVDLAAAGVVTTDLQAPWGVGFLPDGSALISERDSTEIKMIPPYREGSDTVPAISLGTVNGVTPQGEGGLLGLAVSPSFESDRTIFVYFTGEDGNQVDRLTVAGNTLSDQQPVLTGIPSGNTHNGGRIVFGPDKYLYIGTGDAGERENAQDLTSLAGKILRIAPDGSPATGNPFPDAPLVYSLGHRNVQGITFDEAGRVWAAEFGPSSVDELNLIVPGDNYGWPAVEGIAETAPYVDPERVWPTSEASPSGIAFAMGSLWMAGLGGETLWEIPVRADGTTDEPVAHLDEEFGRLRTVVVAPDKSLWVSTSNTDGRGDPADDDDRILRFTLS